MTDRRTLEAFVTDMKANLDSFADGDVIASVDDKMDALVNSLDDNEVPLLDVIEVVYGYIEELTRPLSPREMECIFNLAGAATQGLKPAEKEKVK